MEEESGVVREISWRDVFPWIVLVKSFRIAISVNGLLLSLTAVVLISMGWNFSKACFLTDSSLSDATLSLQRQPLETWPGSRVIRDEVSASVQSADISQIVERYSIVSVFRSIADPFRFSVASEMTWDRRLYFMFGGMFSLAVCAFFGLAISRIAVVRYGRNEVVLLAESIAFAARKWFSCLTAPLIPFAGVMLLLLPSFFAGLIMRSDIGVLLVGILWFFIMIVGFAMAVLAIGLFFGWPFMWGTIASEGTDGFDAISRAYSYTFQRPIQTLIFALMAILLGLAGSAVFFIFVETIIELTFGGVAWGAGRERYDELCLALGANSEATWASRSGFGLIQFFSNLVRATGVAFNFGFFWSVTSAIYLLKRQQVDQTEFDDIFFHDQERSPYGLPHLGEDEHGVPVSPEKPSE